jgi:hypothetical protein
MTTAERNALRIFERKSVKIYGPIKDECLRITQTRTERTYYKGKIL